jgi:hypothetical protein
MTKRFAHIQKLVEIRRDIHAFPAASDRILLNAIIRDLPPQHKALYFYATECAGWLTSAWVADHYRVKQNHASMLLNELWKFDLLKREAYTDEHGKGFKYQIAP